MRVGSYQFQPRWWLTLLTLVVAGLLGSLGNWQLQRASQKESLLALRDQYSDAAPVTLEAGISDPQALRLRPVEARGHYLPQRQMLLDNRIHESRVGFEVLTPLVLGEGETEVLVLVNRGWVPMGASREDLPVIEVSNKVRIVRGIANHPPQVGMRLGSGADTGFWPRVVQYADPEELAWVLRRPVLPIVLQLDPAEPDGYFREWKVVSFGPERHRGYAFQWFSLMAAVLVLYLVLNVRRVREGADPSQEKPNR